MPLLCQTIRVDTVIDSVQFQSKSKSNITIKRLTRRSYSSMSTTLLMSQPCSQSVISSVSIQIKCEIQELCSEKHETVLRDSKEAIQFFSWEQIWLELEHSVAILVAFLKLLIKSPEQSYQQIDYTTWSMHILRMI